MPFFTFCMHAPLTVSIRSYPSRLFLALLTAIISLIIASTPTRAELTVTSSSDNTIQPTPAAIAASDRERETQRQLYKQVKLDLKRSFTASFTRHHDSLKTYPLYPYLQYARINHDMTMNSQGDIDYFLHNFKDVPAAKTLRNRWLQLLYKKQRWQLFMSYYTPDSATTAQQCRYHYARFKRGLRDTALRDALSLWTVGKSQPQACDPLFELLTDNDKITEAIAWQRYTLAISNRQFKLARYIERFFTSQAYRDNAAFYRSVDSDPSQVGNYSMLGEDSVENRAIIEHGITHLAKQRATEAMKHWARYRQSHSFDNVAQKRVLPHLVKGLHKQQYEAAALGYLNDNIDLADHRLLEWQLRILLRGGQWLVLKDWIPTLPQAIREEERWRYWLARAQLMTSDEAAITDAAKTSFRELSRFRSFYGFLASDRVENPYRMAERPLSPNLNAVNTLANTPAMQRVRELFVQGENYSARREWYAATRRFTNDQWLVAAQLANQNNWFPQAIQAMAAAKYWDDINIRFRQAYRPVFEKQAHNVDLPLTLLFAVSRQESAFAADVTSPAGARGLMQLMPATAKEVARRHKIRYKSRQQLFDPEKNISLGSRYLKDLMSRFDDNRILSIASYNAGPHRVATWQKKTAGKLPYDVWIETIPFNETRQYVQNVLAYTLIFAHHLDLKQPLLTPTEKQQLL